MLDEAKAEIAASRKNESQRIRAVAGDMGIADKVCTYLADDISLIPKRG